MSGDLARFLRRSARETDRALDRFLPSASSPPRELHRAIRYAVFPGGKRIRPAVVRAVCEAFGGRARDAEAAGCAIELIHSYSLVHDDLPCMDDDDLRRGKPSCHVRFGEATAILAGDALQAMAFEVIARRASPSISGRLLAELSRWIGPQGLVGGQVLDMADGKAAGRNKLDRVRETHLRKTAALFICSSRMGGISTGVDDRRTLQRAETYGRNLGLLFQAVDDLLDSGEERDKLTLPAVIGERRAMEEARRLAARARRAAGEHRRLVRIVEYVLSRAGQPSDQKAVESLGKGRTG